MAVTTERQRAEMKALGFKESGGGGFWENKKLSLEFSRDEEGYWYLNHIDRSQEGDPLGTGLVTHRHSPRGAMLKYQRRLKERERYLIKQLARVQKALGA